MLKPKNYYVRIQCETCGHVLISAKKIFFAIPNNFICPKCNPSREKSAGGMVKKGMVIATVIVE